MKQAWCLAAGPQQEREICRAAREVDDILERWVPFVVGARTSMVVAEPIHPFRRAGEALGYDRMLKAGTAKRRVHSLLPPGLHVLRRLFQRCVTTGSARSLQRFSQMLQGQPLFADVFGPV